MRWFPLRTTQPMSTSSKPILAPLHAISFSDLWIVAWCLASGALWAEPKTSWDGNQLIFHLQVPLTAEEVLNAYRHDGRIRELIQAYQECKRVLVDAKQQRGQP